MKNSNIWKMNKLLDAAVVQGITAKSISLEGYVYDRFHINDRICMICGSKNTYQKKNGKPIWYRCGQVGFKCGKCYHRREARQRYWKDKLK